MKRVIFLIPLFLAPSAFPHGGGEMSASVGPDQGITEFKKGSGFKLSPEAKKRFDLQSIKIEGSTAEIPIASVAVTMKERNLYRIRDGFFSRIDFKELSRSGSGKIKVMSPSLRSGDEIVTSGLGFLRVVEMSLGVEEHAGEEEHSGSDTHSEDESGHHD